MAVSINPFKGLIETKAYPHARARRTTLKQKLRDTFLIFFGYYDPNDLENNHAGVIDWLVFCIIPLLHKAYEYSQGHNGEDSKITNTIGWLISALQILLLLPRVIFAAALTLVSILPVCAVHLAMRDIELKDEVNAFTPESETKPDGSTNDAALLPQQNIAKILEMENTCLEEICDIQVKELSQQPNTCELHFFAPTPIAEEAKREVLQFRLNTVNHATFFQALKKLNIGGIQSHKEKEEQNGYWI